MHRDYFTDSYDYAKRVLIHAIAEPGAWVVHPMLFRSEGGGPKGGGLCIREYASFLGLPPGVVLPGNVRTRQQLVADVAPYFDRNLFLDPDKGIVEGDRDTKCVTVDQVRTVSEQRPGRIVLVFDHAFPDGGDARAKVEGKRDLICHEGLFGGAVVVREHRTVCFIWLSADPEEATAVTGRLRRNLNIPPHRLVAPP